MTCLLSSQVVSALWLERGLHSVWESLNKQVPILLHIFSVIFYYTFTKELEHHAYLNQQNHMFPSLGADRAQIPACSWGTL